jgi:hypothetical protein
MNKDKHMNLQDSRRLRGLRVKRNSEDVYSRRISIPCCSEHHLDNAIFCFSILLDKLYEIRSKDLSRTQQINLMSDEILECNRKVKGAADYSISLPNSPETEFRRTR